MKNKIEDLRNHLFETIEMVKDGDMEVENAKVIAHLSGVLIESAKVEVSFLKTTGQQTGSGFLPQPATPALPAGDDHGKDGE